MALEPIWHDIGLFDTNENVDDHSSLASFFNDFFSGIKKLSYFHIANELSVSMVNFS